MTSLGIGYFKPALLPPLPSHIDHFQPPLHWDPLKRCTISRCRRYAMLAQLVEQPSVNTLRPSHPLIYRTLPPPLPPPSSLPLPYLTHFAPTMTASSETDHFQTPPPPSISLQRRRHSWMDLQTKWEKRPCALSRYETFFWIRMHSSRHLTFWCVCCEKFSCLDSCLIN